MNKNKLNTLLGTIMVL